MPNLFDPSALTDEQRARYDWAVAEYARIQAENRARTGDTGKVHQISPKSALFARLLSGQPALPFPPPTSYSYPWYDLIEKPGKYHVTVGGLMLVPGSDDEHILLNQCAWRILRKNDGAEQFLAFLRATPQPAAAGNDARRCLDAALAAQPEFAVVFGQWGEYRLSLGRIIRRGRRAAVVNSGFDLHTLDGGNPVIVKVLRSGADIRAKADAMLADVKTRLDGEGEASLLDHITLASESRIPRTDDPSDDDLVEYDCDGWVLERLQAAG